MAGVRGNFALLGKLTEKVQGAASPEFRQGLFDVLGAAGLKLLNDEYRTSRNPYGEPWLPVFRRNPRSNKARALRKKKGLAPLADKPLLDTGRMRASAAVVKSGGGVQIFITADYASYHDRGTSRIPQRQLLPDGERGMGPIWGPAFKRESERYVQRYFGSVK